MPTPSPAYWAFLSYCSHDIATARWLQRALETYSIPRRFVGNPTPGGPETPKRFRPVFRDRTELAADADLGARIQTALGESAYLIVVCSPNACANFNNELRSDGLVWVALCNSVAGMRLPFPGA